MKGFSNKRPARTPAASRRMLKILNALLTVAAGSLVFLALSQAWCAIGTTEPAKNNAAVARLIHEVAEFICVALLIVKCAYLEMMHNAQVNARTRRRLDRRVEPVVMCECT